MALSSTVLYDLFARVHDMPSSLWYMDRSAELKQRTNSLMFRLFGNVRAAREKIQYLETMAMLRKHLPDILEELIIAQRRDREAAAEKPAAQESLEMLNELVERAVAVNDRLPELHHDYLMHVQGVTCSLLDRTIGIVGIADPEERGATTIDIPIDAFFDDGRLDAWLSEKLHAEEMRRAELAKLDRAARYEEYKRLKAEFEE